MIVIKYFEIEEDSIKLFSFYYGKLQSTLNDFVISTQLRSILLNFNLDIFVVLYLITDILWNVHVNCTNLSKKSIIHELLFQLLRWMFLEEAIRRWTNLLICIYLPYWYKVFEQQQYKNRNSLQTIKNMVRLLHWR